MTKLFLGFYIYLLGAVSFHNFYVSTTSIRFVPDEKSLQITTQVFLDDFESVLKQNGHEKTKLIPEVSQEDIDILVEDYLRKNITFKAQEKTIDFGNTGIVLLSGKSGIGKTSILDAIIFALFGIGHKLVSIGKKSCKVVFEGRQKISQLL